MKRVWVLGNGQLGAMLKHAGMPMSLDVRPVALKGDPVPKLAVDDVVTAEIEKWPEDPATLALASHTDFANLAVFSRLADRKTQKELIDSLGIPTAPWRLVDDVLPAESVYAEMGSRALMKMRTGGYDGRGQYWLKQAEGSQIPDHWRGESIVEQAINFDEEMAIVGVRSKDGQKVFFPLTLTLQLDGVLTAAIAPLSRIAHLQAQAESMLGKLLDELDYVGALAMECFRVGDDLLINELAPRVHNTAHWTQAGATISQFEMHLRAVAGFPLAEPVVRSTSVMINLLGTEYNQDWWSVPGAFPYWYGKEVRAGRKVGHINLSEGIDGVRLKSAVDQVSAMLPERYDPVISWVNKNI